MAQIEIKNLTFTYAGEDKNTPAIRNISMNISRGDFIVICGKTGCGKSTLLRNLKPAIRPAGRTEGVVCYENKPIDEMDFRKQAQEIGFVMQNPEHQIVTDKVWHELSFGLENLGISTAKIRLRVAEMAEYFGITDWMEKSVEKLSGGQKQLMNLAVMAMDPAVMVLDEPTAQLDPIEAENFIHTLKKINQDLGITIILSEHRLDIVLPEADRVFVMNQGEIVQQGNPQQIAEKIAEEDFLQFLPVSTRIYHMCGKTGIVPISVAQGRKWIEDQPIRSAKFCTSEKKKREEIIRCKNVWYRYEKKSEDIIKGLECHIYRGEIFAILGGNGTGKTTMLSLLAGIRNPYRGKIEKKGKSGFLPQDVQTLFVRETVAEELEEVSGEIIEEMELAPLKKKHPYDISGGQQQKVALAKVFQKNPDIFLLDEPTKALDPIYKKQLGKKLKQLSNEGKTVILVSHDVDFCGEYAHRCGLFANGKLTAVDNFREFFCANRFYTTTLHKIFRNKIKDVVRMEDIVCGKGE